MLDQLAPAIALRTSQPTEAGCHGPLAWRVAAPLIGSISIGLWLLVGKAVMLVIA